MKCDGIGLIMSDVENDDLSSIASGTTYMDDTTYQDAMDIIEKYRLKTRIPIEVLQILGNGLHNQKTETPKTAKIENYIIANNNNCLKAMEETAKSKGYKVIKMQIFGEIKDTVKKILENISEEENTCLILGGEPTVRVSGKGLGGRNQELVLRHLKNTQKLKKITIASGTTYMDDTTYQDAMNIIEKYRLKMRIPIEVLQILGNGLHNQKAETPKRAKIENYVIANNNNCLKAMEETAKAKGYKVIKMQIFGEIKYTVKKILENISEEQNTCLILGGEPTVKVLGKGQGGRNQELVLRILKNTQKLKKITIASMGTDGIDGNSNFAGAIIENIKMDLNIMKEFLKNSDSSRFFQKQKGNIKTDFTHMNLIDIGVILK